MTKETPAMGGARFRAVPAWAVYIFGSLGAILWGYDTGVISGALLYIKHDFAISPAEQGFVTASITIGAGVGALLSSLLADRLGRKRLIFASSIIFIIGTLVACFSPDVNQLVAGRVILGLGIGVVAVNVPIYLAEISPAHARGRVGALTQLMIAVGILTAYLANLAFSSIGSWQWMLGIAVVPAAILLVGVLFLPESPRWLLKRGRVEEARAGLIARKDDVDVEVTITEIHENLQGAAGSWRTMLQPWARRPLVIAVLMPILVQFLGINTIVYYAPTILTTIGFSNAVSLVTTVGFGIVSIIFTILAIRAVDRAGRRKLLLTGALVMGASMLTMSLLSWTTGLTVGITGILAIICLTVFKATFSMTWGTVARVVQSEVLPLSIRGSAMSLAEVFDFGATFAISLLFPILLAGGSGLAFFVFAVVGVLAFFIVLRFVPETKGRSLEEIEHAMRTHEPAAASPSRH